MKRLILFYFLTVVLCINSNAQSINDLMIGIIASSDSAPPIDPPVGLEVGNIAYLGLDETSGTIAYDATGNYNFTNQNVTVNQSGKIETAYQLTGTSTSRLYNPDLLNTVPPAFSISTWVYFPTLSTMQRIFGKQNGNNARRFYLILINNSGYKLRMDYEIENSGYIVGSYGITNFSAETWYHIVLNWSETNGLNIYVNNSIDLSVPSLTTMIGDAYDAYAYFSLGSYIAGTVWYSSVIRVDESAVWERELTTDEITLLYNSGNGLPRSEW